MNSLWLILILLLLATFFAGIEISYNSINKLRFEIDIKQDTLVSHILRLYLKYSSHFNIINKIGYSLVIGMLAISFTHLVHPYICFFFPSPFVFIIIEITLVVILIIGFAEIVAHTLFRVEPNLSLKLFSIPAFFFFVIFFPISWLLLNSSKLLIHITIPSKTHKDLAFFGKSNLNQWFTGLPDKQNKDSKNTQELKIFQNALAFSKVRIRDCMIPRTEIEAISINAGMEDLRRKFISTGYSKIIVYRNSIDNIIGYVNSKELFKHPATIKEKLNQIAFVPETMLASKLLHDFMQYHRSVAVVVDEYGGTSGLVTLEDIMEEIFGEIEDEHDTDDLIEKQVSPHEFVLSSRLETEYLNSKYGLKFPDSEEYDTLAGFILLHHQNLPKPNTIIKIGNYTFKILRVSHTRIELVHLDVQDE